MYAIAFIVPALQSAETRADGLFGILFFAVPITVIVVGAVAFGVFTMVRRERRLAAIANESSCRACGTTEVDADENCSVCGFRPALQQNASLKLPLSRLQRLRYARDSFDHAISAMALSANLAVTDLVGIGGGDSSHSAMEDGQNALMRGWELLDEIAREQPELLDVELAELKLGEGLGRDFSNLLGAQAGLKSVKALRARIDEAVGRETASFAKLVSKVG